MTRDDFGTLAGALIQGGAAIGAAVITGYFTVVVANIVHKKPEPSKSVWGDGCTLTIMWCVGAVITGYFCLYILRNTKEIDEPRVGEAASSSQDIEFTGLHQQPPLASAPIIVHFAGLDPDDDSFRIRAKLSSDATKSLHQPSVYLVIIFDQDSVLPQLLSIPVTGDQIEYRNTDAQLRQSIKDERVSLSLLLFDTSASGTKDLIDAFEIP